MAKLVYLEFCYPIKDYFVTIKNNEILFEWIIPLIISDKYFWFSLNHNSHVLYSISGSLIAFMAILIGFSITSITVLSTTSNEKISKLTEHKYGRFISTNEISSFQYMHICLTFALIMEVANLFLILLYMILGSFFLSSWISFLVESLILFYIMVILLLNIRNITNFYLIFGS